MNNRKAIVFGVVSVFILFLVLVLNPFVIVDEGERVVILRLGEVQRVLEPGLSFRTPIIEDKVRFQVRTQKIETQASASSKDLQIITANVALQYNLIADSVGVVYSDLGTEYRVRVIDPAIQEAVKAATAKFSAEELITNRAAVKDEIKNLLIERLANNNMVVTNVDIVNFEFSEGFDVAIEAKVTAEQEALRAQNELKRVEFEAQQKIEQAKAEAEAIRIQAQAITQQGGKDFVQLRAVEKWDGKLPTQFVPGSAIPFLNL